MSMDPLVMNPKKTAKKIEGEGEGGKEKGRLKHLR